MEFGLFGDPNRSITDQVLKAIIRQEAELEEKIEYIMKNPAKKVLCLNLMVIRGCL